MFKEIIKNIKLSDEAKYIKYCEYLKSLIFEYKNDNLIYTYMVNENIIKYLLYVILDELDSKLNNSKELENIDIEISYLYKIVNILKSKFSKLRIEFM